MRYLGWTLFLGVGLVVACGSSDDASTNSNTGGSSGSAGSAGTATGGSSGSSSGGTAGSGGGTAGSSGSAGTAGTAGKGGAAGSAGSAGAAGKAGAGGASGGAGGASGGTAGTGGTSDQCKTPGDCPKPTCSGTGVCTQTTYECTSNKCVPKKVQMPNSSCNVATGLCGGIADKCKVDCDCQQGFTCVKSATGNQCISGTKPTYCCAKPGCPTGQACTTKDGGKGTCP